jgi:hypothetical protein
MSVPLIKKYYFLPFRVGGEHTPSDQTHMHNEVQFDFRDLSHCEEWNQQEENSLKYQNDHNNKVNEIHFDGNDQSDEILCN